MQAFEAIGALFILSSIFTIIIHGLVVAAVFLERKTATVNAFYSIYIAGCFADVLALMNGVFMYCCLTGFLQAHLTTVHTVVRYVSLGIIYGAGKSQMMTVLLIAVNRMTAIRFPVKYSVIWNKITERLCTFVQIIIILVYGLISSFMRNPIAVPSSFGGVVTASASQVQSMFWFSVISQTTSGTLVFICYIIIILDIRASYRQISPTFSSSREPIHLSKIAAIICSAELLLYIQTIISPLFKFTADTATAIYLVRTPIYCSLPPYLLIIFSKNIRHRLKSFFMFKRNPLLPRNSYSIDTVAQNVQYTMDTVIVKSNPDVEVKGLGKMQAFEAVGVFFVLSTIFTILVQGLVIAAVFLERKTATVNAFYSIYIAGCFADVLSLVNGVYKYCCLTGFLQAHLITSKVVLLAQDAYSLDSVAKNVKYTLDTVIMKPNQPDAI